MNWETVNRVTSLCREDYYEVVAGMILYRLEDIPYFKTIDNSEILDIVSDLAEMCDPTDFQNYIKHFDLLIEASWNVLEREGYMDGFKDSVFDEYTELRWSE